METNLLGVLGARAALRTDVLGTRTVGMRVCRVQSLHPPLAEAMCYHGKPTKPCTNDG